MANGGVGLLSSEFCWFTECHRDYSLDSLLQPARGPGSFLLEGSTFWKNPWGENEQKWNLCVFLDLVACVGMST